ncbi:YeeE/YedE family protein [Alkalibacter sp. M17DMB]|nr:YeeE/YedE family protein [Alkalibacter mobilis]
MKQPIIAFIVLAILGAYAVYAGSIDVNLAVFLLTGLAAGYILTRSRYGFAGCTKRLYILGEGSLNKALLIMFALILIVNTGLHFGADFTGAKIPGISSVHFFHIGTILGGFIFGIGMTMAGGCASGTLADLGEGAGRAAIALIFFIFGSIPGAMARYAIDKSAIGKIGAKIYLPDYLGYPGTLALSLIALVLLYRVVRKYEDMRKKEGTYTPTVYEPDELPLSEDKPFKLFSYETYHKFFMERWSFVTGGILLAFLFIFILITTGHSWGVTGGFTNWGVAFLQMLGVEFTSPALAGSVATANKGVLNDPLGLRNFGIIVGAAIAMLLAGRFKFDLDFKLKDIIIYAIGGTFMGFGARLAGGCNIGAMLSGIGNFSLSGWIFTAALMCGGITGLKLFEGRVNIIPPNRYKR